MKSETAIGAALAAKGLTARNVELQISIAKFQNNGGEYGVALAMLNAAYGKGSGGQMRHAHSGRITPADASPTNDGEEGRRPRADKAGLGLPSSLSPERSAGHTTGAGQAIPFVPAAAAKLPGHAKRGLAAISAVQGTVAQSLFDTTVLPDGRTLREVRWSECPNLASRYRRLSRILLAIHNVAVPADPNATVDSIVNDDKLNEIVSAVEMVNDVH